MSSFNIEFFTNLIIFNILQYFTVNIQFNIKNKFH